jgi:hypothetical protein
VSALAVHGEEDVFDVRPELGVERDLAGQLRHEERAETGDAGSSTSTSGRSTPSAMPSRATSAKRRPASMWVGVAVAAATFVDVWWKAPRPDEIVDVLDAEEDLLPSVPA